MARIIVHEGAATSFGSGTLIDQRDGYGLVITNWHVVRDARGDIDVAFPNGFSSKARPLKLDADWDLAALVIWRPDITPVKISATAPRPGDRLTICGYGQGNYRAAAGRCTKYYAPRLDYPEHMVELDVEARQGDSGGPIFNDRGELAGVLFGAGEGTTLGSFAGRVESFLATLAPDIGRVAEHDHQLARNTTVNELPTKTEPLWESARVETVSSIDPQVEPSATLEQLGVTTGQNVVAAKPDGDQWRSADSQEQTSEATDRQTRPIDVQSRGIDLFDHVRSALAAVGFVAIVVLLLRSAA